MHISNPSTITLTITPLSLKSHSHTQKHTARTNVPGPAPRPCAQTLDAALDYSSCRSSSPGSGSGDLMHDDATCHATSFSSRPSWPQIDAALSHCGDRWEDIDHLLFNLSLMQRTERERVLVEWDFAEVLQHLHVQLRHTASFSLL